MATSEVEAGSRQNPGRGRWLALGAVIGPALFTAFWLVLGFISPGYTLWGIRVAPYSAISQPVSGLGLGPTAPFMNTAFLVGGLFLLVGIVASMQHIRELSPVSRWGSGTLLALSPLGQILCGIFTLESMVLHSIGFLLALGSPVLSFLLVGLSLRRIPRWRPLGGRLLLASPLTLILVVLFFMTFNPKASGSGLGVAGLTQRILILEVHAWFVSLGWLAYLRSTGQPAAQYR